MLRPGRAALCLPTNPPGRYSLVQFYINFLQPDLAGAAAEVAAAASPLRDWYRAVCTGAAAGAAPLAAFDPVLAAGPAAAQSMTRHSLGIRDRALRLLGRGGPGLTNASLDQGVNRVTAAMEVGNRQILDFERAKLERTFTQKHGDSLAQRLHRLTGALNDDQLPEVHRLLAKSGNKSRDLSLIHI